MSWYGKCPKCGIISSSGDDGKCVLCHDRGNSKVWEDFPSILYIPLLMVTIPVTCLMVYIIINLISALLSVGIVGILMLCFFGGVIILQGMDN